MYPWIGRSSQSLVPTGTNVSPMTEKIIAFKYNIYYRPVGWVWLSITSTDGGVGAGTGKKGGWWCGAGYCPKTLGLDMQGRVER